MPQWNDFLLALIAALLFLALVTTIYYFWFYKPADTGGKDEE